MISREVEQTHAATLLFRTDTSITSLMTTFSVAMGLEYLESTIGPLVRHLMQGHIYTARDDLKKRKPSRGTHKHIGFEINPATLPSHEKRPRNIRNVIYHCNLFLKAILHSEPNCPPYVLYSPAFIPLLLELS